jgi:hypothetical protein
MAFSREVGVSPAASEQESYKTELSELPRHRYQLRNPAGHNLTYSSEVHAIGGYRWYCFLLPHRRYKRLVGWLQRAPPPCPNQLTSALTGDPNFTILTKSSIAGAATDVPKQATSASANQSARFAKHIFAAIFPLWILQ